MKIFDIAAILGINSSPIPLALETSLGVSVEEALRNDPLLVWYVTACCKTLQFSNRHPMTCRGTFGLERSASSNLNSQSSYSTVG